MNLTALENALVGIRRLAYKSGEAANAVLRSEAWREVSDVVRLRRRRLREIVVSV